ncbi:hypothetical protein [Sulfobacillus thermosulfidooxidans]|uniref:hypothetical protein n=1 Tax=Sulfobacillus thermosulfidooxidans TaxID=28034 RepID=UPI0006B4190D|nr:hypothetical protein [Sulfobacillus thermosulfidooxidans]
MIIQSRWRVRPRFFVFLTTLLVIVLWFIVGHAGSSNSHESSPLTTKTLASHRTSLPVRSLTHYPPFALPFPLKDIQGFTVGNNILIAGTSLNNSQSAGVSYAISPEGLVQGPSLSLPLGGTLVISQNMTWWAGGTAHNAPSTGAINLQSHQTVSNFLPVPLSNAGVCVTSRSNFLVGGQNAHGLSARIYQLSATNGTVQIWGLLPQAVKDPSVQAGNNMLVVAGGILPNGSLNSSIWIYQLSSHRLISTLQLPYGIWGAQMVYLNHHFWLLGGERGPHHLLSTIWLITSRSLTPITGHLPIALSQFAAGIMNHQIWIIGGLTPKGPTATIRVLNLILSSPHQTKSS